MKISLVETYARALIEIEKGDVAKDAAVRFISVLKHRGHGRLLSQILAKCESLKAKELGCGVRVRIASESDRADAGKSLVSELPPLLPEERVGVRWEIDPTLVSGFSVEGRDFRIDNSGRRALLELFNKMTA